jgi:glycosyltransferase involved in cell wall biosynthesis
MKVTVVVRTYDRPDFLKEALLSIQLQSNKDWEVLIFDDAASVINFEIYKKFKANNTNKRILYLTSHQSYDMFQNSWIISPDLSEGELMVRLDDDDILAEDSLEFISNVYERNPELDFSYGSSATFNGNELVSLMQTQTPLEAPKTRNEWSAYTIPNNAPWKNPWAWTQNFYDEPRHWSSLVHCSKSNILCIFHTYVMRTSSVRAVKDKIKMTSKFIDDLEFFGSLDYLGLRHASLKRILTYVRLHEDGRVTDPGKVVEGIDIYTENFRIRDKIDEMRPSGFRSQIIERLDIQNNSNNGIDTALKVKFKNHKSLIDSINTL